MTPYLSPVSSAVVIFSVFNAHTPFHIYFSLYIFFLNFVIKNSQNFSTDNPIYYTPIN